MLEEVFFFVFVFGLDVVIDEFVIGSELVIGVLVSG